MCTHDVLYAFLLAHVDIHAEHVCFFVVADVWSGICYVWHLENEYQKTCRQTSQTHRMIPHRAKSLRRSCVTRQRRADAMRVAAGEPSLGCAMLGRLRRGEGVAHLWKRACNMRIYVHVCKHLNVICCYGLWKLKVLNHDAFPYACATAGATDPCVHTSHL